MSDVAVISLIVTVFGALITVIQGLGLWILSDMRRRVERVENKLMER